MVQNIITFHTIVESSSMRISMLQFIYLANQSLPKSSPLIWHSNIVKNATRCDHLQQKKKKMLKLKGLGTQILCAAPTRHLQPLSTPFSSNHWYSKVVKASSNDELSETSSLSSSLGHYAPTQPDFFFAASN